jgi:hypothetical protein
MDGYHTVTKPVSLCVFTVPLQSVNFTNYAIGRQFKVVNEKHLLFKQVSVIDIITALLSLVVACCYIMLET